MPDKQSENQVWNKKYESSIDTGKTAVMTMRWRPLAGCSKLELQQPERHGCQQ